MGISHNTDKGPAPFVWLGEGWERSSERPSRTTAACEILGTSTRAGKVCKCGKQSAGCGWWFKAGICPLLPKLPVSRSVGKSWLAFGQTPPVSLPGGGFYRERDLGTDVACHGRPGRRACSSFATNPKSCALSFPFFSFTTFSLTRFWVEVF